MRLVARCIALVVALLSAPALAQDEGEADKSRAPLFSGRARQSVISRQELHRWQRHVRGFRQEHNFAFSAGVSSGNWDIRRFGTIENRKFSNSGVFARFQYSFHIPIYEGFGYFLGSSTGYHYESTDKRRPFKPSAAVMFPGVLAGLVLNINPVLRWSIGAEAYLERHDGIKERDGHGEDPEISVTMQTYDFGTYFDVFYELNWAIRIEVHHRRLFYQRPDEPQGYAVDANIRKTDQWLGVGLLYHLL